MKGFDVLKVKSAVKSRNKFDLSFSHLTTMDFGEIVPLFARELVPGDEFKVRGDYFSRMAPLVKPTYGKFQFKTISGFVPYHQVAYDADSWISGKTSLEGLTTRTRYITVETLFTFINTYCTGTGHSTAFDFAYLNSSGSLVYRVFTNAGKYWVKVLNSLGYAVPQGVDLQTSSLWYTKVRDQKLSAYPLLAFFKLYNDYMSQSQRFNSSALSEFLMKVKNGISVTGYTPATGAISYTGMNTLFTNLYLNYENDYFTSAWQQPNDPINNYEGQTGLPVPGSTVSTVRFNIGDNFADTDVTTVGGQDYVHIGQRALDFLKSFDDWVRRNNYSGSRDVQQVYSRFGIKIEDYQTRYAHIINTDSLPIQVGDVTATADATGVPLGDYAGKGIMNGSKDVYYKSSDYGMLFIFGYFTVTPMNAFGYDRQVLRSEPLDYYTPEFDGIGADPISLGEVYASPLAVADSDTTLDNSVFGFTERYNNYRFGRDVITGEFRDYHSNGDMNTWHTGRNLSAIRKAGNLVAQSSAMNTLEQTDSQYNRIFSVTSGTVNHFYLTARFFVDAIRPMLNLNQVVRLGEGDTNVPRNGNVVN